MKYFARSQHHFVSSRPMSARFPVPEWYMIYLFNATASSLLSCDVILSMEHYSLVRSFECNIGSLIHFLPFGHTKSFSSEFDQKEESVSKTRCYTKKIVPSNMFRLYNQVTCKSERESRSVRHVVCSRNHHDGLMGFQLGKITI